MAKRSCSSEHSAPARMARHSRSAPRIRVIKERYPKARRIKGIHSPEAGFAFHKAWLDREGIRYSNCGGQIGVRRSHAQGGLLQESGGARSRMEQQRPVLR